MKLTWSSFKGENRALQPLLLGDGQGTLSVNQNPVRGDLRPWRAPLAVATVPAGRNTIYRMGRDVASDSQYWLSWPTVVHAVRGFIADDTTERTYYTGDGPPKWTDNIKALATAPFPTAFRQLGVPAPVGAMTLVASGGTSTLTETRFYVYTYVTDVGEESAPSQVSLALVCKPDATVTISGFSAAPSGNYGINRIRIYRTQSGQSGETEFFFLRELNLPGFNSVKNIQLLRSSWGDVYIKWDVAGNPLAETKYRVKVRDINSNAVLWEKITVNQFEFFDVNNSVPIFGFPPTYLRVEILVDDSVTGITFEGAVTVDNSFVKKVIVFAGQSNSLGHFTSLSGQDARKDLVSAGRLRKRLSVDYGVQPSEIMPLPCAYGSSAADRLADDNPTSGNNYWYDLDAQTDGPRLTQFLSDVQPLASKVIAIIWAQGENDASVFEANGPRQSTLARFRSATTAIFDRFRSVVPPSQAPIVLQMLGRLYSGSEDSLEIYGNAWRLYRNEQIRICGSRLDVVIGSWLRGGERYSGYLSESPNSNRIHYIASVYQDAANDLAESISRKIDRFNMIPDWVNMLPPTAGSASKDPGTGDITISWPIDYHNTWKWRNINVTNNQILRALITSTPTQVFTRQQQIDAYGFTASNVVFDLVGYDQVNDVYSVATRTSISL